MYWEGEKIIVIKIWVHFITFGQGASCTIQDAPLFVCSTISHLCAPSLAIDLITKMDFKWIAGKAHKVTEGVIETQVDRMRKARKRHEMKKKDCGWTEEINHNGGEVRLVHAFIRR